MGTGCEIGVAEDQFGILPRAAAYLFHRCSQLTSQAREKVGHFSPVPSPSQFIWPKIQCCFSISTVLCKVGF